MGGAGAERSGRTLMVEGTAPPFGYVGGKTKTAKQILSYFPDHKVYVEPFFGSGALFFAKGYKKVSNSHDYREVIGDLDGNITNFFEQLRSHSDELQAILETFEYSEAMFARCKRTSEYYQNASPLLKAALVYYRIQNSFGSSQSSFAFCKKGPIQPQAFKHKVAKLPAFTDRLRDAYIFNKPYQVLFERFDSKDTFFYLDPPYKGTAKYLVQEEEFDYVEFAERVKALEGNWILSHYRDEWLEETFSDYDTVDIFHTPTIAKTNGEPRYTTGAQEAIVLGLKRVVTGQLEIFAGT